MKSLEQFIKDNEGKFLEVAGSANAKFQCVDCVNGYIRDVLGFPIIEHTNAIDFKNKANGNYDIIYNDINNPNLVPDVGDIVVYKHPNKIGHIGFCIKKGVATTFGIFEENWPVGSPCKSVLNKKYILGNYVVDYWMKPKQSIIEDMISEEQKRILDFLTGKTEGDVRQAFGALNDLPSLNKKISDQSKQIEVLNDQIDSLSKQVNDLTEKFNNNEKLLASCQSDLKTANKTISNLTEENTKLSTERSQYKSWYETALKDQINKYTGWQLIKLGIKKLQIKK